MGGQKDDILKRMAADDNAMLAESQAALAAVQIELLDAEKITKHSGLNPIKKQKNKFKT